MAQHHAQPLAARNGKALGMFFAILLGDPKVASL